MVLNMFLGTFYVLFLPLGEVSVQILFKLCYFSFYYWVVIVFLYSGYKPLIGCMICTYFLPYSKLSFYFFFFNLKNFFKFIFWLRWVLVAARGLSLVSASGAYCSLRCVGLVASRHVGSSQTRAHPCIGRQILNHCATREARWCLLKHNIFTFD